MTIFQGKRNSVKPHTGQGKNPNPFSAEVKSTETSYSNPSTAACRPQCSLSRMATEANSRQVLGKFQHPFILKCLHLSAWKPLYPCTAMLTLSVFENPKLYFFSSFPPSVLPAPKGESQRASPCLVYRSVGQEHTKSAAVTIYYIHMLCKAVRHTHLSWCLFPSWYEKTHFTNEAS